MFPKASIIIVVSLLLFFTDSDFFKLSLKAESPQKKNWNILLIFSEDHGSHLGVYGDPIANTPNLDRLAERGVRFNNAYVPQSTCSPSRASLLTGTYPQQHGQIGLSVSASYHEFLDHALRPGIIPMPQLLQESGYRTGVLGKIHINPHDQLGFDFMRGSNSIGSSASSIHERSVINRDGETETRRVRYSSDVNQMVDATKEFFEECDGRPFFLYVATGDVHPANLHFQIDGFPENLHQPDFFTDKPFPETGLTSLGPSARASMAAYYNGIDRLDILVGKILNELYSWGFEENTIVLFLSDHGPSFPGASGRGKMTCYEGGLKVPFILHWPDRDFPSVFDGFVSSLDIMPTLLMAAEIEAPEYLPGKPLQMVLEGKLEPHQAIFGEFNRHTGTPPYGTTFFPIRSVRYGDFKLIHNPLVEAYRPLLGRENVGPDNHRGRRNQFLRHAETPEWEFFYLAEDPYEFNNLYDHSEYQEVVQSLKSKLRDWQVMVNDFVIDPEGKQSEMDRIQNTIEVIFN